MERSLSRDCTGVAMPRRNPGQPPNAPRRDRKIGLPGLAVRSLSALIALTAMIATSHHACATPSYYTDAQALAGQTVFHAQCAICHGDALQGKAGPALAGEQFLSVSQYQQLNADYLYRFMSKHMPLNAPGSLSKAQYLDALAYILKVNGYPSGTQALTDDDSRLAAIKIEPTGTSQQSKR
jgi:mono/diheme cytochrome c family protein